MTTRTLFFKGRLVVACIAVLLALGVTALKRDDSRRKAVASVGTRAVERRADNIKAVAADGGKVLKGESAYGDWREDSPGVRRLIAPADMPKPYATKSVDNDAHVISRPNNAWPQALPDLRWIRLRPDCASRG